LTIPSSIVAPGPLNHEDWQEKDKTFIFPCTLRSEFMFYRGAYLTGKGKRRQVSPIFG
jgi:hypothetical protein